MCSSDLSPAGSIRNVYIPGHLVVDGTITNPSDIQLKTNIQSINKETTNKLLELIPSSFTFKNDYSNKTHYGFIAQYLETKYPELVEFKPDIKNKDIKSINYLEIIPLLVSKIQEMQKEIDTLKEQQNVINYDKSCMNDIIYSTNDTYNTWEKYNTWKCVEDKRE